MDDLVMIKTCRDRIEAEVVKGFLQTQGIYAVVNTNVAGSLDPYPFPSLTGAEVKVRKHDVQKAKKLLGSPRIRS